MATMHKLTAVMFTDLAGYTIAMENDESTAMDMLRQSRTIHRESISNHNGVFVKEMGDGNLASFDSATDAVLCAQEILGKARDLPCKIRIGIHLGDIRWENDDLFGDGVNVASRLQSSAEPGGIFISNSVYQSIKSNPSIKTQLLGDVKLKHVREPVKTYIVTGKNLAFPSATRIRQLIGRGTIHALAILPFKSLFGNSEQQYFVDGMQDALIGELSQISALRVISRTSTIRYRDSMKTVPEIAGELDVDGIVEATVFKHDNKVRINAQLIKAYPQEEHLWSGTYEKEIKDVFALFNEVVKDITGKIGAQLTAHESEHLKEAYEVDPKALEAYLKGMFHWEKLNSNDLGLALGYFEQAIKIDPRFAPAYSGMAGAWEARVQMGLIAPDEATPKIKNYIKKANELDDLPDSHFWNAILAVWTEWDWQAGKEEFEKTIELNPNHSLAHAYYAHLLAILGSFDEAVKQIDIAIDLDPFNVLIQSLNAMVLNYTRNYTKAIEVLTAILRDNHNHPVALSTLRATHHNHGNFDEAFRIFKQSYYEKGDMEAMHALEKEYYENGYHSALAQIAELMISRAGDKYDTPWQIATLFTRAGMKTEAIHFLNQAYLIRDPNMPYIGVDPIFDILREDNDFHELLQKMNLRATVVIERDLKN